MMCIASREAREAEQEVEESLDSVPCSYGLYLKKQESGLRTQLSFKMFLTYWASRMPRFTTRIKKIIEVFTRQNEVVK